MKKLLLIPAVVAAMGLALATASTALADAYIGEMCGQCELEVATPLQARIELLLPMIALPNQVCDQNPNEGAEG